MEGRGRPPVLTVRVPVTVATYERLGRLARDSGSTVEDHAGSLLAGAIGGERWTDAAEHPEGRLALKLRELHDELEGTDGAPVGPGHEPTRSWKSEGSSAFDPAPRLQRFGSSPVRPVEGSS
jgi:hypothetical protein